MYRGTNPRPRGVTRFQKNPKRTRRGRSIVAAIYRFGGLWVEAMVSPIRCAWIGDELCMRLPGAAGQLRGAAGACGVGKTRALPDGLLPDAHALLRHPRPPGAIARKTRTS